MSENEIRRLRDMAALFGPDEPPIATDGEADDCPVAALGHRDGAFFFLDVAGQVRRLRHNDLTATGIMALFGGRAAWLLEHFRAFNKDGDPLEDFKVKDAASGLMARCFKAGLFDPLTPQRGIGVWPAGEGLAVHCGDVVMTGADLRPAGFRTDEAIYVAASRVSRPALAPGGADAGARLVEAVKLWRFSVDAHAELLVGAIALAMLGAAPTWRAHVKVQGLEGSGKSTLHDLAAAALGGSAIQLNDFTPAGLHQAFTGSARAILLDEAEADEGGGSRIHQVVALIRRMSGAGVKGIRGSAGHAAHAFTLTGNAFLFGINTPELLPQDRSRFLEIELLRADPQTETRARIAVEWARQASPGLRARMIAGWPRYRETLAVYREALTRVNCNARQADLLGNLLAARDLLLSEDIPRPADADELIADLVEAVLLSTHATLDNTAQQCLTHLVTVPLPGWKSGAPVTIGEMIGEATRSGADAEDQRRVDRDLRTFGVRLAMEHERQAEAPEGVLLIAGGSHAGAQRIFAGTRWARGGWSSALVNLDGAYRPANAVRLGGTSPIRVIAVPLRHLEVVFRDRGVAAADPSPRPDGGM